MVDREAIGNSAQISELTPRQPMPDSPYQIAVLPGDGIGPEVMEAALLVLEKAVRATGGLQLQFTPLQAGAAHYRQTGETLSQSLVESCRQADAVLLAALGLPDVRQKDGTEVQPEMMVGLRRALQLHSAVRPVKLYDGAPSALRDTGAGIDFVIIRENLEGLFASYGGGAVAEDVAADTMVVTRAGTRKVAQTAFRLAQRRNGRPADGQKRVTCVDKANIFRSMALFRQVFFEVAADYADIAAEAVYVDAMSLYMVQNPWDYDVLVMENQFGDILSDLGAGLVGGLGMGPSAELGDEHGLFQPSHGSAPTIAGQNVANPLAMILSTAMMLDWLSERHSDAAAAQAARQIEQAVQRVLLQGPSSLTPDLGGTAGTTDVARRVAAEL